MQLRNVLLWHWEWTTINLEDILLFYGILKSYIFLRDIHSYLVTLRWIYRWQYVWIYKSYFTCYEYNKIKNIYFPVLTYPIIQSFFFFFTLNYTSCIITNRRVDALKKRLNCNRIPMLNIICLRFSLMRWQTKIRWYVL